jgi:hypothetical protein
MSALSTPNSVRSVARTARRAIIRREALNRIGPVLLVAMGLATLVVLVDRVWLDAIGPWWVVPITLGVIALAWGWAEAVRNAPDTPHSAGILDDRLELESRLRAAMELHPDRENAGFVELVMRDADALAGTINLSAALPDQRTTHYWYAGLALIVCVAVGIWFPARSVTNPAPQPAPPVRALTEIETAEEITSEIEQDEQTPETVLEQLEELEALKDELAQGVTDEQEADARTAAKFEEIADAMEDSASDTQDEAESMSESIESLQNRKLAEDESWDPRVEEFAESLRDQEYDQALDQIDAINEAMESMTPEQREQVAEQLEEIANAIDPENLDQPSLDQSQSDPNLSEQTRDLSEQNPEESADPQSQPEEQQEQAESDSQRTESEPARSESSERENQSEQANQQESQDQPQQQEQGEQQNQDQPNEQGDRQEQGRESQQQQQGSEQAQDQQAAEEQRQQQEQQSTESNPSEEGGEPQEGTQSEQQGEQDQQQTQEQGDTQPESTEGQEQREEQQEQGGEQGEQREVETPSDQQGQEQQQPDPNSQRQGDPQQRETPRPGEALEERLREMERQQRQSQQQRERAERLREQAERLMNRDESDEQGQGARRAPDQATPPDMSEGAGDGERDPAAPDLNGTDSESDFLPVDARDDEVPAEGRPIGEWYGPDGEPVAPGTNEQTAQRFRRASQEAQRAVEEQQVPRRYRHLVREVFQRVQERAEKMDGSGTIAPQGQDAVPSRPKPEGSDNGG